MKKYLIAKTDLGYIINGELEFTDNIKKARLFTWTEIKLYNDSIIDDLQEFTKATSLEWIEVKEDDYIGVRVKNINSNKIGIILRINESGSIQVLEKIEPYVICTHDSWKTLEVMD